MTALRITPPFMLGSRRAGLLIERNLYVYKHGWMIILSGFFEPLFYLVSIGFGLGALIGTVPGPGGTEISYQLFVAPALLATASMNGAMTTIPGSWIPWNSPSRLTTPTEPCWTRLTVERNR